MATIFDSGSAGQTDIFWRNDQNWHIYEQEFKARTPAPGAQLVWDTTGEWSRYKIGLAKARALDQARKALILAQHEITRDVFGLSLPSAVSRSVDGVEGAPDEAIKF